MEPGLGCDGQRCQPLGCRCSSGCSPPSVKPTLLPPPRLPSSSSIALRIVSRRLPHLPSVERQAADRSCATVPAPETNLAAT
ncbi:hypothetical protein AOLI_G00141600 [Acnodon oligacanthus]